MPAAMAITNTAACPLPSAVATMPGPGQMPAKPHPMLINAAGGAILR